MSDEITRPAGPGITKLADRIAALQAVRGNLIIGLTGSVASGKTTLAQQLSRALSTDLTIDRVSTDGFLFSNTVLEERSLTLRKGFPETYDTAAMATALTDLRQGEALFPAYSHITYDIDPELARQVKAPDIFILEGLGFQPPSKKSYSKHPDLLIYLDAEHADLETWFLERFLRFWHAAEHDPSSFYARFRHMSEPELIDFAKSVWAQINLPNLEQHIQPLRAVADIVILKNTAHAIKIVVDRTI